MPSPVDEQDTKRFVSKDIALRKTPRFDGKATSIIKAGSKITATGRSPDGLWRYVTAGKKKGWVPRFALTEKAIDPSDKPSAGRRSMVRA